MPNNLLANIEAYYNNRNDKEVLDRVMASYNDELTFEDLRERIQSGNLEGINGLWFAVDMCINESPAAWEFILKKFGNELTMNDFRIIAQAGDNAGRSCLWKALYAAATSGPQVWEFIKEKFGDELLLDDFRLSGPAGPHKDPSGIRLALSADKIYSPLWEWVEKKFSSQLKHEDINESDKYGGSVLYLLALRSSKSSLAWNSLFKILLNCEGEPLEIAKILNAKDVPDSTKKLLTFYNQIADLKKKVKEKTVTDEQCVAEVEVLFNGASELSESENKSEYFYFLAKLLFTAEDQVSERMQCYRQVKEGSLYADRAAFEIASMLATGLYDKEGKELTELEENKQIDAKMRAFEEALSYAARSSAEFIPLRRRLVALLLGHNLESLPEEYSWADEMMNIVDLLHEITRIKFNALIDENGALLEQLRLLQSASSTYAEQPALLQNWDSKNKGGLDNIIQPDPDEKQDVDEERVKRARSGVSYHAE